MEGKKRRRSTTDVTSAARLKREFQISKQKLQHTQLRHWLATARYHGRKEMKEINNWRDFGSKTKRRISNFKTEFPRYGVSSTALLPLEVLMTICIVNCGRIDPMQHRHTGSRLKSCTGKLRKNFRWFRSKYCFFYLYHNIKRSKITSQIYILTMLPASSYQKIEKFYSPPLLQVSNALAACRAAKEAQEEPASPSNNPQRLEDTEMTPVTPSPLPVNTLQENPAPGSSGTTRKSLRRQIWLVGHILHPSQAQVCLAALPESNKAFAHHSMCLSMPEPSSDENGPQAFQMPFLLKNKRVISWNNVCF